MQELRQDYLRVLLEKDRVKPPYLDENAHDRCGRTVPRCANCHLILSADLCPPVFCPACGQRLLETPNDGHKEDREVWASHVAD